MQNRRRRRRRWNHEKTRDSREEENKNRQTNKNKHSFMCEKWCCVCASPHHGAVLAAQNRDTKKIYSERLEKVSEVKKPISNFFHSIIEFVNWIILSFFFLLFICIHVKRVCVLCRSALPTCVYWLRSSTPFDVFRSNWRSTRWK